MRLSAAGPSSVATVVAAGGAISGVVVVAATTTNSNAAITSQYHSASKHALNEFFDNSSDDEDDGEDEDDEEEEEEEVVEDDDDEDDDDDNDQDENQEFVSNNNNNNNLRGDNYDIHPNHQGGSSNSSQTRRRRRNNQHQSQLKKLRNQQSAHVTTGAGTSGAGIMRSHYPAPTHNLNPEDLDFEEDHFFNRSHNNNNNMKHFQSGGGGSAVAAGGTNTILQSQPIHLNNVIDYTSHSLSLLPVIDHSYDGGDLVAIPPLNPSNPPRTRVSSQNQMRPAAAAGTTVTAAVVAAASGNSHFLQHRQNSNSIINLNNTTNNINQSQIILQNHHYHNHQPHQPQQLHSFQQQHNKLHNNNNTMSIQLENDSPLLGNSLKKRIKQKPLRLPSLRREQSNSSNKLPLNQSFIGAGAAAGGHLLEGTNLGVPSAGKSNHSPHLSPMRHATDSQRKSINQNNSSLFLPTKTIFANPKSQIAFILIGKLAIGIVILMKQMWLNNNNNSSSTSNNINSTTMDQFSMCVASILIVITCFGILLIYVPLFGSFCRITSSGRMRIRALICVFVLNFFCLVESIRLFNDIQSIMLTCFLATSFSILAKLTYKHCTRSIMLTVIITLLIFALLRSQFFLRFPTLNTSSSDTFTNSSSPLENSIIEALLTVILIFHTLPPKYSRPLYTFASHSNRYEPSDIYEIQGGHGNGGGVIGTVGGIGGSLVDSNRSHDQQLGQSQLFFNRINKQQQQQAAAEKRRKFSNQQEQPIDQLLNLNDIDVDQEYDEFGEGIEIIDLSGKPDSRYSRYSHSQMQQQQQQQLLLGQPTGNFRMKKKTHSSVAGSSYAGMRQPAGSSLAGGAATAANHNSQGAKPAAAAAAGQNAPDEQDRFKNTRIKKMYQDILNVIPEGVALISAQNKLVYANKTISRILRCPKNQIISTLITLATKNPSSSNNNNNNNQSNANNKQEYNNNDDISQTETMKVFSQSKFQPIKNSNILKSFHSLNQINPSGGSGAASINSNNNNNIMSNNNNNNNSNQTSTSNNGNNANNNNNNSILEQNRKSSSATKLSLFNRIHRMSTLDREYNLNKEDSLAQSARHNNTNSMISQFPNHHMTAGSAVGNNNNNNNNSNVQRKGSAAAYGQNKTLPCDANSMNSPWLDDDEQGGNIDVESKHNVPSILQSNHHQGGYQQMSSNAAGTNNHVLLQSKKTNDYSDIMSVTNYFHLQQQQQQQQQLQPGLAYQRDSQYDASSWQDRHSAVLGGGGIPAGGNVGGIGQMENNLSNLVRKQQSKKFKNSEILKQDVSVGDILSSIFEDLRQDQDTKTAKTFKLKKRPSDTQLPQIESKKKISRQTSFFSQMKQTSGYFQCIDDKIKVEVEHQNCTLVVSIVMCEIVVSDFVEQLAMVLIDPVWQEMYEKKLEDMNNYRMKMFASLSHELRTPLNCSISMLQQLKTILKESMPAPVTPSPSAATIATTETGTTTTATGAANTPAIRSIKQRIQEKLSKAKNLSSLHSSSTQLQKFNPNSTAQPPANDQLSATKATLYIEEYIDPALNSSNLLLNLINDILDFVQIDSRKFKFYFIQFDLEQLLSNCLSLVSVQSKQNNRGVELVLKYDENCPKFINSDPNRIRQIVLNFLSNAIKFTQKGQITLTATLIQQNRHNNINKSNNNNGTIYNNNNNNNINNSIYYNNNNNNNYPMPSDWNDLNSIVNEDEQFFDTNNAVIEIGVEDQGIGISREDISKIFTIFNKIDLGANQTLNSQGCGLGLTISNSISKGLGPVQNYQGIRVQSQIGQGSIFSILVEDREEELLDHKVHSNQEMMKKKATINSLVDSPISQSQYNKSNANNAVQSGSVSAGVSGSISGIDPNNLRQSQLMQHCSSINEQFSMVTATVPRKRINSTVTNRSIKTNKTSKSINRKLSSSVYEDSCCVVESEMNRIAVQHFTPTQTFQIREYDEASINAAFAASPYDGQQEEILNNSMRSNFTTHTASKAPLYKSLTMHSKTSYKTKTLKHIKSEQKEPTEVYLSYSSARASRAGMFQQQYTSRSNSLQIQLSSSENQYAVADQNVRTPTTSNQNWKPKMSINSTGGGGAATAGERAYNVNNFYGGTSSGGGELYSEENLSNTKRGDDGILPSIDRQSLAASANGAGFGGMQIGTTSGASGTIGTPLAASPTAAIPTLGQQLVDCTCAQLLVVDDNDFNIHALTLQLKTYGFTVDKAFNGAEAVEKVKARYKNNHPAAASACACGSRSYRMIFMDIEMPIRNGYEATQEIREFFAINGFISKFPIIVACTAYVSDEDKHKALSNGMDDFIKKPVFQEGLDLLLEEWYNTIFDQDLEDLNNDGGGNCGDEDEEEEVDNCIDDDDDNEEE